MLAPFSPSALLHLPRNQLPPTICSNVLFRGTYTSWCSIHKRLDRDHTVSQFTTFWGNPHLTPGMDNSRFCMWRERGIAAVKDVFDPGGKLYSFEQLKAMFNIPNTDFYMYLQIRHFIQSSAISEGTLASKDAFLETMRWIKSRPFKIRYLYPSLLEPTAEKAWHSTFRGWSKDIPDLESYKGLTDPCALALRSLPSAALQETYLRTLHRAYISPAHSVILFILVFPIYMMYVSVDSVIHDWCSIICFAFYRTYL